MELVTLRLYISKELVAKMTHLLFYHSLTAELKTFCTFQYSEKEQMTPPYISIYKNLKN